MKDERRSAAKQQPRTERREGDEDPDIAGIVPGPQPSPWGEDGEGGEDEEAGEV